MSRTNIDVDDELLERAMQRYNIPTKREAVNRALESFAGRAATKEEILAMEGMGWEGDLDAMRDSTGRVLGL